jgi:hypothetical protein
MPAAFRGTARASAWQQLWHKRINHRFITKRQSYTYRTICNRSAEVVMTQFIVWWNTSNFSADGSILGSDGGADR